MYVWDSLLPCNPLYGLGQTVKNEGGRPQSKGEDPVEEVLPLPLHAQQVVVLRVDGVEAEGTFDVHLGHERSSTELHHCVHCVVHCRVVQWEVSNVNPIINACSWRVREV